MDIQTKDGILLRNIPEGTPDEAIKARIAKIRSEREPAEPAFEREAREIAGTTPAEAIAANPTIRVLTGAARPIMGAAALLERPFGLTGTQERMRQLDEMQARGARALNQAPAVGIAADVTGALASPVTALAAKAPAAAGYLPMVAQGAEIGGIAGLTSGSQDPMAAGATGAAVGGAIPGVGIPLAVAAKGAYRALVEPWMAPAVIKGRAFLEAAGDKADDIIALLRQNKQIVPGATPTAGEAAAPAGRVEFAALQKSAERGAPSQYLARTDQQNAARLTQVRSVGQTPAALEAAEATRGANAAANYGAAREQVVPTDATLNILLRRPSMDKAISRAAELAKEAGQPFVIGSSRPAQQVPSQILNASGAPAIMTNIPATNAQYPVASLHYIKTAMDDLIKNPERFGIGATEAKAMANTQRLFVNWLENKVPAYKAARVAYAADSAPVNQMQIGQYLEGKLVPALSEEAKQRSGIYAQALRDAPGTIKRATGAPRFQELSKALTPEQLAAVNSVRDDLARSARFEEMANRGAGTANAMDIATGSMEQAVGGKIPNPLNRHVMVFNQIMNRLEGKINKKLAAEIAVEMLNPPAVGESITKAMARAKRNEWLAEQVQKYYRPALAASIQEVSE